MKIMFVVPRMGYGGTERQVALLSNEMSKRGHKVMVYSIANEKHQYAIDDDVQYITGKRKSGKKRTFFSMLGEIKTLKNTIASFAPSVIVPIFTVPLCYILILGKTNKSFKIITSERSAPTRYSFVKKSIIKLLYKSSDGVVCQSRQVFDYLSNIPENKKIVIPNAVCKNDDESVSKDNCIIAAGRLEKAKRFDILLRAYNEIKNEIPSVVLNIYGSGSMRRQLEKMIIDLDLSGRVFLKGTTEELFRYMKKASICVISSDHEGFPNVMIEAMAAGIPVVSTDFFPGNAKEILGDGEMVVKRGDYVALGRVMYFLLSNDKARLTMGQNNLLLSQQYSIDKIADRWENFLLKTVV